MTNLQHATGRWLWAGVTRPATVTNIASARAAALQARQWDDVERLDAELRAAEVAGQARAA